MSDVVFPSSGASRWLVAEINTSALLVSDVISYNDGAYDVNPPWSDFGASKTRVVYSPADRTLDVQLADSKPRQGEQALAILWQSATTKAIVGAYIACATVETVSLSKQVVAMPICRYKFSVIVEPVNLTAMKIRER